MILSTLLCTLSLWTMPLQAPKPAPVNNKTKWEYLVVSFGKTMFSSPFSDPELKSLGLSKILFYSQFGIIAAQEAIETQRKLDTLGKFGWELVSVVGQIGGDQQMMFKRVYDPTLTKAERELIKEEGKNLEQLKSQKDNENDLIELDEQDKNKEKALFVQLAKRRISLYKEHPFLKFDVSAQEGLVNKFESFVIIQIDGTSKLLKNNTYRSSEANEFAKQVAQNIHDAAKLGGQYQTYSGNISISVEVVIKYKNKLLPIASHIVSGILSNESKAEP